MNVAPRKRGSFEDWVVALCREARWRGHQVELYTRAPVHPELLRTLAALRVRWAPLEDIERRPVATALRWAREVDAVHLSFLGPRSRVAQVAYAAWPATVLYVAHSDYLPPAWRWDQRLVDGATMLRVDGLAGVSAHIADLEGAHYRVPRPRRRVIHNGVDVQRFRPGATPNEDGAPRPVRLVTVAHLTADKGVDRIIRGLSALDREATLTIAGDGPELERLQAQAIRSQVADRVRFVGLCDDVPALLAQSDIFVHCAAVEAFGLSIAEAMAAGLAVVASRTGGVPELVEHRVSGILVSPRDGEGWVRAVRELADRPDYRRQLGEAARKRIRQAFTVQQSAYQHLAWCEETAGEGLKGEVRRWLRAAPEAKRAFKPFQPEGRRGVPPSKGATRPRSRQPQPSREKSLSAPAAAPE